jgi:hypothetical protein
MSDTPIPPQPLPLTAKPKSRKTLFIVLACVGVSLVIIVGCMGVNFFALKDARRVARMAVSRDHVEAIGKALTQYARANGEALPEIGTGWERRLNVDPRVFRSPNATRGEVSYIYVPGYNLSGLQRGSLTGGEIVLYENPALEAVEYPVLFVDGRMTLMKKPELEWLLKAGGKPVYR